MISHVLSLHFAPSQASSRQNSDVDSYLQYCEVGFLKPSKSESSLPTDISNRKRTLITEGLSGLYAVFTRFVSNVIYLTDSFSNKVNMPANVFFLYVTQQSIEYVIFLETRLKCRIFPRKAKAKISQIHYSIFRNKCTPWGLE